MAVGGLARACVRVPLADGFARGPSCGVGQRLVGWKPDGIGALRNVTCEYSGSLCRGGVHGLGEADRRSGVLD